MPTQRVVRACEGELLVDALDLDASRSMRTSAWHGASGLQWHNSLSPQSSSRRETRNGVANTCALYLVITSFMLEWSETLNVFAQMLAGKILPLRVRCALPT